MFRLYSLALLFWMSLFEAVVALFALNGLTMLPGHLRRSTAFVAPATFARLWQNRPRSLIALTVMLLPAAIVHLAAAGLHNWELNPRLRLLPGFYPDRQIWRVDIPTTAGPVPALHIVPISDTSMAVCVAHGSGCNKTFYTWALVDTFIARGIAVVLIDLDGHGESPRPQAFPTVLHSILGSVEWLRTRYARVGVVGTSLGGCIAARAVADGAAANALVVLEAPPRLQFTRQDVYREGLYLLQPTVLRLLRDSSLYHVIRAWDSPRIRATISTWDLIEKLDLIGSLQRIASRSAAEPETCTLLLLYGGRDAIVKPAQIAQIRQALPPAVPMHVLAGASHLSLNIDPRTLHMMGSWLEAQLRGKGRIKG